ncbi:MAG: Spy/CpxP family protein refolding chaperone [Thermodesulfobacteriota bacterium]|nr:Spy/CpxP family protein refolding chaperone [Thermodesulfobacteriota bacterium]
MRSRTIVIAAFVLAIVFAVSSMAMARGFGKSDRGYRSGQGLMGLRTVMELNLSDSQKDQALKIMETYQIDRVKARGDLIRDRDNLRKTLQVDKVNEQGVRKAYKKLSLVREDRLIARTKMMTEMKAILTPEQVKLLDERTAERFDRMKSQRGYGKSFSGGCFGDCTRK